MTDTHFDASSSTPSGEPRPNESRIDRERAVALSRAVSSPMLEIVDETASTNTDLMQRMKAMPREGAVAGVHVVRAAYRQTAGRGRQGRSWQAEPGRALMFSVGCIVPRPLSGLAGLSLAVGAALVERLRALPGLAAGDAARIGLKWPNDLLLDGGKLAGILVETAWSTAAATAAVIGVGINVRSDPALDAELAAAAAALPEQARPTPPAALSQILPDADLTLTLAAALAGLSAMLDTFSSEGFAGFRARWSACHAYAGREVVLLENGEPFARGTALGVDAAGQLLLETADGIRAIATGDVSLRLAPSTP